MPPIEFRHGRAAKKCQAVKICQRVRDFVGVHRVLTAAAAGMAGKHDVATAALQELRRTQAQYHARLDRKGFAYEAERRPRALSGRISQGRAGLGFATAPEKRKKPDGRWATGRIELRKTRNFRTLT